MTGLHTPETRVYVELVGGALGMRDGRTVVLLAAGYCVKMSTIETLRAFVNQRLTAAVEDILGLLETTISNYEEVIDRQRRLLEDTVRTDGHTDTAGPSQFVLILCFHSTDLLLNPVTLL